MNTSGGGSVNAIVYLLVLAASVASTERVLGDIGRWLRVPRAAAVITWAAVAIPSLAEFADHSIFTALARQPDQIRRGQLWRLLTAVTVQDGGLLGTAFNLIALAFIMIAAVHLWGPMRAVGLFLIGAVGFNLLATYVWPSPGAGNSGATFFVATSMVGLLIARRRTRAVTITAILICAAGLVLLILHDAHSEPILAGLLVGAAVAAATPKFPLPMTPGLAS